MIHQVIVVTKRTTMFVIANNIFKFHATKSDQDGIVENFNKMKTTMNKIKVHTMKEIID